MKTEAKEALKNLKFKLENVAYGGGAQAPLLGVTRCQRATLSPQALQKKFENYARAESDDDVRAASLSQPFCRFGRFGCSWQISAKVGGDLGLALSSAAFFANFRFRHVAREANH